MDPTKHLLFPHSSMCAETAKSERWEDFEFFKQSVIRIDSAAQRVRAYFTVLAVVSAMLSFATWNRYLAWVSWMLTDSTLTVASPPRETTVPAFLRTELYKQWVDGLSANIPLVGIKISVNEAPTVGLAALILLATWAYFAARR